MRLATLLKPRQVGGRPGIQGVARVDRHTEALLRRLRRGDIAVIDHLDLDKVTAEALVRRRVAAVVNAAPSSSGRYPNLGPEILVTAGVPLVDAVGPEVLASIEEGDRLRIDGDRIFSGDNLVAIGICQSIATVEAAMVAAHAGLAVQLEAFAGNTVEYIRRDRELLLDGVGVPDLRTKLAGRSAVLVMNGAECASDLSRLRPYLKNCHPVLLGVGEGADALLAAGYRPHLVVGEPDALSDDALRCGAEVVVHVHRDGGVRGLQRVEDSGAAHVLFAAGGNSEDVAMLLADDKGAQLIVTAGASASLIEFFDQARTGMASTFVTRLRVGGKLVDARAVSSLHRPAMSRWPLLLLVLAALVAIVVGVLQTPSDGVVRSAIDAWFEGLNAGFLNAEWLNVDWQSDRVGDRG
jgi:uncharacterized membrane-anchored protein